MKMPGQRTGKNYWMVVQSLANYEITRQKGFTVYGLGTKYRRRAQRMQPDDRMLFYIRDLRKWGAVASVTSTSFEDHTPIWKPGWRGEDFIYRVKIKPSIVLNEEDYIDALVLGPRLEYVKRWPPERWPLAFFDSLHLLPQRDFRLIEGEFKRISSRRRKKPRRVWPKSDAQHPQGRDEPLAEREAVRFEASPDVPGASEATWEPPPGTPLGPLSGEPQVLD